MIEAMNMKDIRYQYEWRRIIHSSSSNQYHTSHRIMIDIDHQVYISQHNSTATKTGTIFECCKNIVGSV